MVAIHLPSDDGGAPFDALKEPGKVKIREAVAFRKEGMVIRYSASRSSNQSPGEAGSYL